MVRPCSSPASKGSWQGAAKPQEHAMSHKLYGRIAVIGIDIGKNSFHVVGQDRRRAIVVRQKPPGLVEARGGDHSPPGKSVLAIDVFMASASLAVPFPFVFCIGHQDSEKSLATFQVNP